MVVAVRCLLATHMSAGELKLSVRQCVEVELHGYSVLHVHSLWQSEAILNGVLAIEAAVADDPSEFYIRVWPLAADLQVLEELGVRHAHRRYLVVARVLRVQADRVLSLRLFNGQEATSLGKASVHATGGTKDDTLVRIRS